MGTAAFDEAAGARCDALAEVTFEGSRAAYQHDMLRIYTVLDAGLLARATVERIVNVRWNAGDGSVVNNTASASSRLCHVQLAFPLSRR
jgi:hypothetical protein